MTPSDPARMFDRSTPPHIVTLVLIAGLSAMNMSAFLPSLPSMAIYFDTEYAVMQLSVSLYLVATALLQLGIGPVSDRFGRRPVAIGAIVLFVVATFGCLMSPNVTIFLIFRMLQSFVVAGLVLSRAIVRDMHGQDEAASKIGYVTMGMALVPMIAPTIGGALDQLFGWKSTFVMLALSGIAVAALCWADLGETAKTTGTSFRQQIRDYPQLFASPRFWGYALATAFASGAFFAFLGGAPYAASEIFGLSPLWTGFAFGAPAVGYALGNFVSGRFAARFGINQMILWGAAICSGGLGISVALGMMGALGPFLFFAFCTSVGVGNGMVIPNGTAGLLSVRPHLAGTASGLGGAIMIGGGAVLSVLAGHLLEGATSSLPLQWLMFASTFMSLLCILYVMRRERYLRVA